VAPSKGRVITINTTSSRRDNVRY